MSKRLKELFIVSEPLLVVKSMGFVSDVRSIQVNSIGFVSDVQTTQLVNIGVSFEKVDPAKIILQINMG